jgi:hypothetical protein
MVAAIIGTLIIRISVFRSPYETPNSVGKKASDNLETHNFQIVSLEIILRDFLVDIWPRHCVKTRSRRNENRPL